MIGRSTWVCSAAIYVYYRRPRPARVRGLGQNIKVVQLMPPRRKRRRGRRRERRTGTGSKPSKRV